MSILENERDALGYAYRLGENDSYQERRTMNTDNTHDGPWRIVAGCAANIAGLLCVIWPVLPKQWGAWEFVGRLFGASKDPGMGIQYMFIWLATIPFGWLLCFLGTRTATGSGGLACVVALAVVGGAVYAMVVLAG